MCILVFAPQRHLQIEYATESVWLQSDGKVIINADLLVTNKSAEDIEHLLCVVPQSCGLMRRTDDSDCYEFFVNQTDKMIDDAIPGRIDYPRYQTEVNDDHPGQTQLKLTVPDPTSPSKDIIYSGRYSWGCGIRVDSESAVEDAILDYERLAVLKITPSESIPQNNSRWFRFRIAPATGTLDERDRAHYIYDWLRNKLTYNFGVSGPLKIFHTLSSTLKTLQKSADLHGDMFGESTAAVLKGIEDLYRRFVLEGVDHPKTELTINDWRTRFFKCRMEPFSSIQQEQAVVVSGSQPNVARLSNTDELRPKMWNFRSTSLKPGSEIYHYYEWKTGFLHVPLPEGKTLTNLRPDERPGYFAVRFSTKFEPIFFRVLPYLGALGLLISIASLMLTIVNMNSSTQ